jgi:hypothetical protein
MIRVLYLLALISFLYSCEEVIEIDLNTAEPIIAIEGIIYNDSVCNVTITQTTSYFSVEESFYIDNATVSISDGSSSEILNYQGEGLYLGKSMVGTEGRTYTLEIAHEGELYLATSTMPEETRINSIRFGKDNMESILNPTGETVFTITVNFTDNPETKNYYMITFVDTSTNQMIEKRYFLVTDNTHNGGSLDIYDDTIFSFSESIFYEGGIVETGLHSIDETTYQYFFDLDDVLFW